MDTKEAGSSQRFIGMRLRIPAWTLVASLFWCGFSAAEETPVKTKEKIPALVSLGVGYGDYELRDAYAGKNAFVKGYPIAISGVVEQETIQKYKDKVPAKFRKAATSLSEAGVSHIAVPDVLYIHPYDGEKEAFGGTWGWKISVGAGFSFLKLGVTGGIIGTYLYYQDARLHQTVNFLRPGLHGKLNLRIPMFTKYLIFEAGYSNDLYWGQTFFSERKMNLISGTYGLLHLRVPYSVDAAI